MIFSKILLKLEVKEMGLKLLQSTLLSFLSIVTTLEVFKISGNLPSSNIRFKRGYLV